MTRFQQMSHRTTRPAIIASAEWDELPLLDYEVEEITDEDYQNPAVVMVEESDG